MWSHASTCACSICTTFHRIFALVSEGSGIPNFIPLAGRHVRVLEGELRDTLEGLLGQGRREPPSAATEVPPPPAAQPQAPPEPPVPAPKRESSASASQPPARGAPGIFLYPKSKPTEPGKAAGEVEPKVPEALVEPEESSPKKAEEAEKPKDTNESSGKTKSPVIDVEKKKKHKERRRTRSRSRRRRRETEEVRSPKRGEEARRSANRSRGRSHRSSRGREKKARPSADRRSPLRPKSPPYPPGPRSPSRPPPGHSEARGSGWRGVVPYSSHPRWTESKNKGVTKRAKQELYNQRRSGYGR